jgi:hypothetical protein
VSAIKKLFIFVIALCTLLMPILASQAFSLTYYVCIQDSQCNAGEGSGWTTGSDSTCDGTIKGFVEQGAIDNCPWKTVQNAADESLLGGDIVVVGDGDYSGDSWQCDGVTTGTCWFSISGTYSGASPSSMVTFKGENLHGAKYDGNQTVDTNEYGIDIDGDAQYIRLENFEIQEVNSAVVLSDGSDYIYIYRIKGHDFGWNISTDQEGNKGWNFTTNNFVDYSATNITIDSCEIYNVGRLGPPSSTCDPDDNCRWDHGIYLRGKDHVFKNNLIYNIRGGFGIVVRGWDGTDTSAITATVVNNTFADHTTAEPSSPWNNYFSAIGQSTGGDNTQNWRIHNNIIYNWDVPYVGFDGIFNSIGPIDLSDSEFKNNVTDHSSLHTTCRNDGCSGTPDTADNTFSLSQGSFGFTDAGSDDYTLLGTAIYLIDQGLSTYAPDEDILGNARPQGAADDAGAYEYYKLTIYYGVPSDLHLLE